MTATMGSCGSGPLGVVSRAFGCMAAATAGEAVIAAAPVATPAVLRNERRLTVFIVKLLSCPLNGGSLRLVRPRDPIGSIGPADVSELGRRRVEAVVGRSDIRE